ncbi:hypothetical protein [Demequina sp. NBRC 110053]|uniref:hypothetical protein n=1 Tax=Demequina sp. NBRC 110053 TaxID=1570342 RepID=UPI000A04D9B6|nr:hypothetical protein [Demequina sp. NBRC 110053]
MTDPDAPQAGASDSPSSAGPSHDDGPGTGIPPEARRDLRIFVVLMGLTVLLYALAAPWAYAMIVTGPVAAAFGALALWRSRRAKGLVGFRVSVAVGIGLSLFSALVAVSFMMFAAVLADYSGCMERAVSQEAQNACQADYEQGINDRLESLLERFEVSETS